MRSERPRRGIERKILTSILVVGILPMILAAAAFFVVFGIVQVEGVKEELLSSAAIRANAVRVVLDSQWNFLNQVASDRETAALLSRYQSSPEEADFLRATLRESLLKEISRSSNVLAATLHDGEGRVVASTRAEQEQFRRSRRTRDLSNLRRPELVGLRYLEEEERYGGVVAQPIYYGQGPDPVGYLSITFDFDELLRFTFLPRPLSRGTISAYQVAWEADDGEMRVAFMEPGAEQRNVLRVADLDPRVADILRNRKGEPQTLQLAAYSSPSTGGPPQAVFLAYWPILSGDGYMIVYRARPVVYGLLKRVATIIALAFLLVIAVLCFRAYRHVHNNIVRPVMLLNEGAQIIGQGDLELKLKIGTGDEIEELATSFNKMALALKRNIRRLEESEERYRSLVTSMRDGIYQTDRAGTLSFVNPAGVEIFGYTQHEEVLGQKLHQYFLAADDYERFTAELEEKGFVERSRIWMKRRDGRAICVELSGNVARDDNGEPDGVEGTFRDVTKTVRLEQEAQERAEHLSAISQIANVINSSLEAGRLYESLVVEVKKLVDFDYAALALLQGGDETFQVRQLWPEQSAAGTGQPGGQARADGCAAWVARQRQCLLVHDLSAVDAPYAAEFSEGMKSCLCVPLYATGRIIGSLNLAARRRQAFTQRDADVLEQMAPHVAVAIRNAQLLENLQQSLQEVTRAREELHAANEELKTLDEMKTNLLSNVSHELRTPLVSVMGYTDMIYNGKVGAVNETQKEYLAISLRNIEKLVTLIENLLDFSRLHRGAENVGFDTFDLVDCARGSIQVIRPVADERGITVELIAPDDRVLVEGDKGKLGQVFINLLSNAVKFNHDGGTVTVEIEPREETVEAIVSDTGIGIPPEALDKIFTRFYQYDSSSTRKYGGTGIGLSIAQDIARLHGSRISVSSEPGHGAVFRFTLPLSSAARRIETLEETAEALLPPTTQLLIELVTQDRALSAEVRNCLLSEGMDVIQAVNTDNAVALARRHSPDCILVDMEMENGHGPAALDTLLADPATGAVPLIILTNDNEAYDRYRPLVASRVKRAFRKSSLLSGIRYALNPGSASAEPLGRKILCVDDDPEVLTFIGRLLEGEGVEVDRCTSGTEALERIATREYGLVLLDIAMPGIDGWETCRRIKSDPSLQGIKVYMVTAKPVDPRSPRTQEAGADGMLAKPFKSEDLVELVRGFALSRTARDE
jgi:PAS domain S-box-containing protein